MTATNWPAPGNVGSVACVAFASLGGEAIGLVGSGSPHAPVRNARAAIAAENAAPLVCVIVATAFVKTVCFAVSEPPTEEPVGLPFVTVAPACGLRALAAGRSG